MYYWVYRGKLYMTMGLQKYVTYINRKGCHFVERKYYSKLSFSRDKMFSP